MHNFGLIDIQIVFSKNWYKNFLYSCSHYFCWSFDEKLWVIAVLVSFLYRAQFSQVLCIIFFLSDVGDFGKKCLLPVFMKNSSVFISNSLKFLSSVFNSLTSQKLVLCLLWGKEVIHAECLLLSWTFLFNGFSLSSLRCLLSRKLLLCQGVVGLWPPFLTLVLQSLLPSSLQCENKPWYCFKHFIPLYFSG